MDILDLFIMAVIFSVIGFLFNQLIHLLKSEPQPVKKPVQPSGEEQPSNLQELGRLLQDPQDGSLVVEVGGEVFREAGELSLQQREQVENAYAKLGHWLGLVSEPFKDSSAEPASSPPVKAVPVVPERAGSELDNLGSSPQRRGMAAIFSPTPPPPFVASETIAQQVDRVLQEMLIGGPLADRIIRVVDGPDQGIRVLVDSEQYEGIDAVPEGDVQLLLKKAVEEWRRRALHL